MNRLVPSLLSSLLALAHGDLPTLVGTIANSSGASVAGSQAICTEIEAGIVSEFTTKGAGEFVRPALKPSPYTDEPRDGLNTIAFMNPTAHTAGPSVETTSEMTVDSPWLRHRVRTGGGVVNILKSGHNERHGRLLELLPDKDLDLNSWTNNLSL